MKKFLLITGAFLVLAGAGMFWYLSRTQEPQVEPGEMVVQGSGGLVVVKDVYEQPAPDAAPPVLFNDNQDVILSDTLEHQTLYFAGDQGFLITLTDPDLPRARAAAEEAFLERLQIDREAACQLKVSLSVPYSVHAEASGRDYGLSFCPDGEPLPNF